MHEQNLGQALVVYLRFLTKHQLNISIQLYCTVHNNFSVFYRKKAPSISYLVYLEIGGHEPFHHKPFHHEGIYKALYENSLSKPTVSSIYKRKLKEKKKNRIYFFKSVKRISITISIEINITVFALKKERTKWLQIRLEILKYSIQYVL